MKHFYSVLCIIMIVMILVGCSQNMIESPQDTNPVNNVKVSYFHADWPEYNSLDTLIAASSNVFEGKLKNIYFDVVDLYSGEPADNNTKSSDMCFYALYTIYEVEVNTSYKGVNTDTVRIKIIGGMEGYKESAQYAKLTEYDLFDEGVGISVLDCFEPLAIGETYLFLTGGQVGPYHKIINTTQFAYDTTDSEKVNGFSFNEVKSYVTSMPSAEKS